MLSSGYDFYSSLRLTGDGARVAWLAWNHPDMPWDQSELWIADVGSAGALTNERHIAGGGGDESIVQPEWAPDGSVAFVSDRSGWWNLYRWTGSGEPIALAPMEAEFAGPQWVFGLRWYGIAPDGTIYAVAIGAGERAGLWVIPVGGKAHRVDMGDHIESLQVGREKLLYVASGWDRPKSLELVEFDGMDPTTGRRTVLRSQFELPFSTAFLSQPEEIEFPTTNGKTAFAFYYPPTNPDVVAPDGERPPLVVMSHGGPTSSVGPSLDLEKNAFTSRGFAVVDVNYRGSTGFGRDYMRSLDGMWGVYDVDDCIAAARYLADRGDVDPERLTIRGGSAGGYTTLAALAFHDVFAAGASHYGVGDLEGLARFTHKYEATYLDRLVAPYPAAADLYRERSPIYHVDQLSAPLIVFQGVDDHVVPIAQAEQIVEALRQRKIPHAYLPFEGEGHGFRQAANIRRALEAELSFYAQVFGFELADDFEPVAVSFLAH